MSQRRCGGIIEGEHHDEHLHFGNRSGETELSGLRN